MSRRHLGRRSPPTIDERAARILRDLRALAGALAERRGMARGELLGLECLNLGLSVPIDASPGPSEQQELVTALSSRLDAALKSLSAYHPGRVYCFLDDSNECVHSSPPDRRSTFAGYRPNGTPQWESFTNVCISRQEPRVDRLYGDRPEIIAIVQQRDELNDGLMAGFGKASLTWDVLGQVVTGLIPVTLDVRDRESERVALTVQLVMTRNPQDGPRLRLNLIGLSLHEVAEVAAQTNGRGPAESLRRTLRATRDRVRSLEARLRTQEERGEAVDVAEMARPLLIRLRGDIERVFRPLRRRTKHAQVRHEGGDRPTGHALTDARNATTDKFILDTERDTIVVLGRRGRAHVFNRDGRHVTSLVLRPGEVERKTERRRWKPLSPTAAAAFLANLEE